MSVDPRVIRGVVGKARLVLTACQFKYFQMYYEHEIPVQEIARQCKRNPHSVYKTLQRAREKMKDEWA